MAENVHVAHKAVYFSIVDSSTESNAHNLECFGFRDRLPKYFVFQ
jgi:hypothetical protein